MANTPTASITNENGQFRSASGPAAIEAYRLRTMIVMLRLWSRTGIQPSRGIRILKVAQDTTGMRTRDTDALTAKLTEMMNAALSQCEIGTLTTPERG